jgi:hypothetical protein
MNENIVQTLRRIDEFPIFLTEEHVAKLLGLGMHNIPVLVRAGLLKPLGHHHQPGCVRLFSKQALLAKSQDEQWLGKVADAVKGHWREKNAARKLRLAKAGKSIGGENQYHARAA